MTHQELIEKTEERNEKMLRIFSECPEIVYVDPKVNVLRKKASEVTLERGVEIGNKLKEVLVKYRAITGYGRGLAAPQIGLGESVFVAFAGDQFTTYINPKITEHSENYNLYREACLSCPYIAADVKRSASITLVYTNEQGKIMTEKAEGFLSRLLQHEYDHLQGVLNIDVAEKGGLFDPISIDPLKEELRMV